MARARCCFNKCNSLVISIKNESVVQLPQETHDQFQLMGSTSEHQKGIFLVVPDIWDFDNVGVSKELPQTLEVKDPIQFKHSNTDYTLVKCVKYLICADCDRGPIGLVCDVKDAHDKTSQINLLSLHSVSTEA